jgi:multiple sugar transport system substrate-binding protein
MIVGLQNEAPEGVVLAMTTYPSNDPLVANFGRASMFLSITTHSEHQDEAAALINFWMNHQPAHELMRAERGVIPNTVIADAVADMLSPMAQLQSEFVNWMSDGNSTPVNPPRPEGSARIIDELVLVTEMVAMGLLTPQEAAERYYNFGNSILR